MTTPFYEKARNLFLKTQNAQILKGLQKYPEPFNPHNWTSEELLNHALEEAVDLTHYLVGLKEQLDAKDEELDRLRFENDKLKRETTELKQKIWLSRPKKPVRNLAEEGITLPEDYIAQLEQELRYLKSENTRLQPTPKYFDADDQ